MAEISCAHLSGQIALITAQNGPAAILLVPALAAAYRANVSVCPFVQKDDRNPIIIC